MHGADDGRRVRADVRRNRDAIIAAAAEAFLARGVDASLEDIAKAAGVGSATLHRHFPTRDELIAHVYRRDVEKLCTDVDPLLARLPSDESLKQWMIDFVVYVAGKRGMAAALRGAACESEPFVASRAALIDAITRLVRPGIEHGVIRPDANPEDVMRAMCAFCLLTDQHAATEPVVRLVTLLVDGLRPDARSQAHRAAAP